MAYVLENRLSNILALPFGLAQTELRRGKQMLLFRWALRAGERLELKTLALHLLRVLTPGILPHQINTSLGVVSVGLYQGDMLTSGTAVISCSTLGVVGVNSFARRVIISPGIYSVLLANNSDNMDVAVSVNGSVKLYLNA